MTRQLVSGNISAAEIAKRNSLDRNRLKNWSYRYRKGLRRRTVQGRPWALDRTALEDVRSWLIEDDSNLTDIPSLKRHLNEGYRSTKRRYMHEPPSDGSDSDECVDEYEKI